MINGGDGDIIFDAAAYVLSRGHPVMLFPAPVNNLSISWGCMGVD